MQFHYKKEVLVLVTVLPLIKKYMLSEVKKLRKEKEYGTKNMHVYIAKTNMQSLQDTLSRNMEMKLKSKEHYLIRKVKKRKQAWKDITIKGDFAHNMKVYEKGEIIPCKRPQIAIQGTKYVQCKECLGTYHSF